MPVIYLQLFGGARCCPPQTAFGRTAGTLQGSAPVPVAVFASPETHLERELSQSAARRQTNPHKIIRAVSRHSTRCELGQLALRRKYISQGAGFEQRGFDFFQISFRHNAEPLFKPHGRQRADGLHVGDGFGVEKRQMAERHLEFAPAILPRDGNVDDERTRDVEIISDETTAGRVLAAMPMSTSQTSPWRGFICRRADPVFPARLRVWAARRPNFRGRAGVRGISSNARLPAPPFRAGA